MQQQQQQEPKLLQQNPVEIHQLSYQKQFDYEKALAQKNYDTQHINDTIAAKSTSQENNSDYNLLYRNEPKSAAAASASAYATSNANAGMSNGCIHDTSSATNTLSRIKDKKSSSHTSTANLGIDDGHFYANEPNKVIQKPLDLTHIM